jgi:hypothetical protein
MGSDGRSTMALATRALPVHGPNVNVGTAATTTQNGRRRTDDDNDRRNPPLSHHR